jgi:L-methionine (R)-S-oxide reductase
MTIDSDIKSTQVKFWEEFLLKAESLVDGQTNWVSNLSNISALLYHELRTPEYPELAKDVNWAGFYLLNEENPKDLILGPFQGKIACVQIPYGKGVCGAGYKDGVSQLIHDVHQFPGHIACDSESESELVVPIFIDDKVNLL